MLATRFIVLACIVAQGASAAAVTSRHVLLRRGDHNDVYQRAYFRVAWQNEGNDTTNKQVKKSEKKFASRLDSFNSKVDGGGSSSSSSKGKGKGNSSY